MLVATGGIEIHRETKERHDRSSRPKLERMQYPSRILYEYFLSSCFAGSSIHVNTQKTIVYKFSTSYCPSHNHLSAPFTVYLFRNNAWKATATVTQTQLQGYHSSSRKLKDTHHCHSKS